MVPKKKLGFYCVDWIPPCERRSLVLETNEDAELEEYRHTLLVRRDWAIIAASLATIMALVGLVIYGVRKPKINRVAVFTLVLAGLSAIGVVGNLKLRLVYIALHICVGSALAFAIAVTIALDAILEVEADFAVPQPLMLLILLIPYLVILVCSLVSTLLAHTILKIEEMAKANLEDESVTSDKDPQSRRRPKRWRGSKRGSHFEEMENIEERRRTAALQGQDVCCMCMENQSTNAFVPCGHMAMCEGCAQRFQSQSRVSRCPICRGEVHSCIKIYGRAADAA